jgi:3-oxoadipate enol-lactonase
MFFGRGINQKPIMAKLDLEPGLSIHYYDLNPGGFPVLILLHGLGATADSWQLQFPSLIDSGFRILVPEMRGFGKSTYPGGENNPQVMAEDVAKFLTKMEIESLDVAGISMGGTIALQLAIDHPTMVNSLILVNTFARLRPKNVSYLLFYSIRFLLIQILGLPNQARYLVNRLFPRSDQELYRQTFYDQIIQSNPIGYRSTIKSYVRFDITNRLYEIQSPTLVVTGDRDAVVPPRTQSELAEKIPHARQAVIDGAGHAVIVEKPDEFNQTIIDFLGYKQ